MRMKIYHVTTRTLFEKFGREWFPLYSFYNHVTKGGADYSGKTLSEYEAREQLTSLFRHKLLIRQLKKTVEHPISARLSKNDLEIFERWRLSGKAIFELKEVFDDINIEVTDSDYSEYAKLTLTGE